MEAIKFIDLFAGMGGIRIPFDELGYKCVFSSEWDEKACDTYFANFGDYPSGDITQIDEKDIPSFDICLWLVMQTAKADTVPNPYQQSRWLAVRHNQRHQPSRKRLNTHYVFCLAA